MKNKDKRPTTVRRAIARNLQRGGQGRLHRRYLAPAMVSLPFLVVLNGGGIEPPLGLLARGLDTSGVVLVVALLVICLGIHEAAHAWVADRCGDPTAKDLGRITINPVVHIDPMMTIIVPFIMYMSVGFIFGGAKPVPVNIHRLRKPLRDMMLVALAGPVSNFVLAIMFAFAYRVSFEFGLYSPDQMMGTILQQAVFFNLLLAAFNMMPIPPLDGSRVLAWLLPANLRPAYVNLERYGMLIVMGVLFFPLTRPHVHGAIFSAIGTMGDAVNFILDPALTVLHSVAG